MDSERLGLSPEQQAHIDNAFLETTVAALTNQDNYYQKARLVRLGDLSEELEKVHTRTFGEASKALVEDRQIDKVTLDLIAQLAFIDALALPSADKVHRRDKVARAFGDFNHYRRLFAGLPFTEDA